MILLQHVGKRYPTGQEALTDVTLELKAGEMIFLTGHSGAGKSTLLKLIAMIERPSRGQILVNGRNLANIKNRQIPFFRRQMGMIFQDHHLLHDRSVGDNVALPLVIAGLRHAEILRRVRASLDKVGLLHKERALPITLSTGEQQRVGIARAVVNKPPFLLADEPTGNLDPELSLEIMRLFDEFNRVGVTVLVASHDLELIRLMNKRVISLHLGRLEMPHPSVDQS